MSRKQQMIVAEGISKKNILPRFGTNNQPNLKLEQDMRKFMEPKPKLEEASGGSTLADANANNVTGDGAVGPAAAEAAGASGVNEPVLRAVGEQASNLAARATSGDDQVKEGLEEGRGTNAIIDRILNNPEHSDWYKEVATVGTINRAQVASGNKAKVAHDRERAKALDSYQKSPWRNEDPNVENIPFTGTQTGKAKILGGDDTIEYEYEDPPVPAIGKSQRMPGHGPDRYEMGEAIVNEFMSDLTEVHFSGETLSQADRDDVAAELRGARTPISSLTNRLIYDLVQDEKANVSIEKAEKAPKWAIKNSEDRLNHYRFALGKRQGLMKKKMGF